jgi:hypothetical protein
MTLKKKKYLKKSKKVSKNAEFHPDLFFKVIFVLFQTLIANSQEKAQKKKIFFYECVLEFNYATIKGFA